MRRRNVDDPEQRRRWAALLSLVKTRLQISFPSFISTLSLVFLLLLSVNVPSELFLHSSRDFPLISGL